MDTGSLLLQLAFGGLMTGAIYALVALGFNIVFKSTDAINFAQGEWVMAGGMIAAWLHQTMHLPLPALVPMAVACVGLLGLLSERLSVYPLREPGPMTVTLVTIGFAITTKALVMLALGKQPMSLPSFSGTEPIAIGGATLHPQALWIVGLMFAVMAGIHFFFERTLLGRAMKAAAADREAAAIVGINVPRTVMWSFMLAALVGAIAGVIITPITLTSFNAGTVLGFKGFSAAMLGGLGNLPGALVGGLLLGLLESFSAAFISSKYKDAVAFLVLLFLLFYRPSGLLGRASITKV
jgi:branched-chain amino acid transport system permease protein